MPIAMRLSGIATNHTPEANSASTDAARMITMAHIAHIDPALPASRCPKRE